MDSVLDDGLLVFGSLAILLAPMALALAKTVQVGNSSRFFAVPSLHGSFFRLKSAHRACGVGPSVGMRDADANELQSTPRVIPRRLGQSGHGGALTRPLDSCKCAS
jgi:hypothetical protein